MVRSSLAALLSLVFLACQRPQPSPDYARARTRYAEVVAGHPIDAYSRPEMDEVLDLLDRVPRDSLDAAAAEALQKRILDARRELAAEEARRSRLAEGAGVPTAPLPAPSGEGAANRPGPDEAAPPPQAAPPSQLAAGTSLEEFRRSQGNCFEPKAAARIGQPGGGVLQGEAWALRDDEACRKAHPAEVGRVVLFSAGALVGVRDQSEAKPGVATEKVEGTRLPDGRIRLRREGNLPPGATIRWNEPPAAPPAGGGR